MVRCAAIFLLFSAMTVSAVFPAFCQDDFRTMVDGTVVSVEPRESRIVVRTIEDMDFTVLPEAKIVNEDGFDIELSGVDVGSYVMVEYDDDDKGRHMAKAITVEYKE